MNQNHTTPVSEKIDFVLAELKCQLKQLISQNAEIKRVIEEEKNKSVELRKVFRARRPFTQTKTGEMIFPGKKQMEFKLDVMQREILKLKSILDGLRKNRCQTIKEPKRNIESEQLIKEYNGMLNEFDEILMEISKTRVTFDALEKQTDIDQKEMEQDEIEIHRLNEILMKIESNESNENVKENLKNEHTEIKKRLDDLKSLLTFKKNEYMIVLKEKQYLIARADDMCNEKARLTAEFERQFNRMKEYVKTRLSQVEDLPAALKAAQKQLFTQKKLKIEAETAIGILSKQLKMITDGKDLDATTKSELLMSAKARNDNLKEEKERMEKELTQITRCIEEKKRTVDQQKRRQEEIINETSLKINKAKNAFKEQTTDHFIVIDKLYAEISKIEASSCFENEKLIWVSTVMGDQMDSLKNILKNAQEQRDEMMNMHTYISTNKNC